MASPRPVPSPTTVLSDTCAVCGVPADKLCAGCHTRVYCGAACQRDDRRAHKAACRAIASSRAAGAEAAGANAADVAAVRRGDWTCTGCAKVVTPEDEAERCEGCTAPYCCERCRVSHWGAHMAACADAAAERGMAGGARRKEVKRVAQ